MNKIEFREGLKKHPDLEYDGCSEETEEAFVLDHKRKALVAIKIKSIAENTWEAIGPVLTGERPPTVMIQLSRVVGYFARITNWNPSKREELHDRHKGDYEVKDR